MSYDSSSIRSCGQTEVKSHHDKSKTHFDKCNNCLAHKHFEAKLYVWHGSGAKWPVCGGCIQLCNSVSDRTILHTHYSGTYRHIEQKSLRLLTSAAGSFLLICQCHTSLTSVCFWHSAALSSAFPFTVCLFFEHLDPHSYFISPSHLFPRSSVLFVFLFFLMQILQTIHLPTCSKTA